MKERLLEEMRDELILNDYPHVQFIHFQVGSFRNISSLTISDLPELKLLIFEIYSFYKTTSLTLSSIFDSYFSNTDIPFSNGEYTHDTAVFFRLYSNHFQYDESISFHSSIH